MVSATCTVNKGDFPIDINWMFNGDMIPSMNSGISISRTNQRISTLSIEAVRDRHRGNYTCIAKNFAGFSEITTILFINGTFFSFDTNM